MHADLASTNISSLDYDETTKALRVTFVTGGIYVYADVPVTVVRSFIEAPSAGEFFNDEVKDVYAFTVERRAPSRRR